MNFVYHTLLRPGCWNLLKNCLAGLPAGEAERIMRITSLPHRSLAVAGKLLLVNALRAHNIIKEYKLPALSYTAHKRPFIKNMPFDFNISHSGNAAVCALSLNGKIGIDIEQVKPVDTNMFDNVFTPGELAGITTDANTLLAFYKLWTAKEATIKAEGTGFYSDARLVKINNNKGITRNRQWNLFPVEVNNDYVATVAVNNIYSISVSEVTMDVLMGG
ncbi:MAG TPA: 4'-phosphopantetheinyl transferase superfamily protein [Chitinophagaceae bacterium]|nr:4'-phosphopantetheinyl transferase superfamily protein [Chitinophagaceae bacterium]